LVGLLVGEERNLRWLFLNLVQSRDRVGVYLIVGGLWSLLRVEVTSSGMRGLLVAVVGGGGRRLSDVPVGG